MIKKLKIPKKILKITDLYPFEKVEICICHMINPHLRILICMQLKFKEPGDPIRLIKWFINIISISKKSEKCKNTKIMKKFIQIISKLKFKSKKKTEKDTLLRREKLF
jgi:hypothetical protein